MPKNNHQHPPSFPVRLFAASFVGGAEGFMFAPLDAAKQFQMHNTKSVSMFQAAVGPDYKELSFLQRVGRAWGSAGPYCITKIVARGGKLSTVPAMRDGMKKGTTFKSLSMEIGPYNAGLACSTVAGMGGGALEALTTQPLDRWKVDTQVTKKPAMKVARRLLKQPFSQHYTGLKETLWRNAWGSGVLFFTKDAAAQALGAKDLNHTTTQQKLGAGFIASCAAIIVSHPQDIAKVRKQMYPKSTLSITGCMRQLVINEGLLALGKGLPIKLATTGVKLGLVLAGVDEVTEYIAEKFSSTPDTPTYTG